MNRCEGFVVTKDGTGILTVRLNRPAKKNSFSLQMYKEFPNILADAAKDPEVTVLVLTGTGDYFSSGNDLTNFSGQMKSGIDPKDMVKEAVSLFGNFTQSLIDFPKPLVALVNGPAIGIAFTLLGLVDLIYASDATTFKAPFTELGIVPEGCSSFTFPRILGPALASDLIFFNRVLPARDAKAAGFITDVFPVSEFEVECRRRLDDLCQLPPNSLRYSKQLMRDAVRAQLNEANAAECRRLEERFLSDEAVQAVMKFFMAKSKM